jgi:hypothetical protein
LQTDLAYKTFSDCLTRQEALTIKAGKGGLSYYKNGVFVCHFNARPQAKRHDLAFADFRYDALRPFLDIEKVISSIQQDAQPAVQITPRKLWCSLHFPISELEHVAHLFLRHIISKVSA